MENKSHIKMTGVVFIFRNNSTGKPTKYHIINDNTNKSFCGFDDYFAEVKICDDEIYIIDEICKKCLKKYNRKTPTLKK